MIGNDLIFFSSIYRHRVPGRLVIIPFTQELNSFLGRIRPRSVSVERRDGWAGAHLDSGHCTRNRCSCTRIVCSAQERSAPTQGSLLIDVHLRAWITFRLTFDGYLGLRSWSNSGLRKKRSYSGLAVNFLIPGVLTVTLKSLAVVLKSF
jgi:hypothetical protein